MTAGVLRRAQLSRHPQSSGSPAVEIEVGVAREASALVLMYTLRGDIAAVALPGQTMAGRTDALWQHTCFEAFLRDAQSTSYWEFNLSPSREWAAYRFDAYREGMTAEPAIADPHIELLTNDSELRLSATLDLSGIAVLSASEEWRLGLSAVIENTNGSRTYWALAHPPGKPDFHHVDAFTLSFGRTK